MNDQKKPYRYAIEQCDVVNKTALAEFRAKRLECLEWLNNDEVHAIWPQLSAALWNDVTFRTIADMANGFSESALHNTLLAESLLQGYYSTQVLVIRRLFDKRSDVISLRRIVGDIGKNLHLFTRENYVCSDGLPYDYEAVEQANMIEVLKAGGGCFWAEREGPKAYTPSKMLHAVFDELSGVGPDARSRSDQMSTKVPGALAAWLDECGADEIVTWSHKMLAHAADSASRGRVKIEEIRPSLDKFAAVHRASVRVAEALGAYILADSGHGAIVPVPQFNQFEKLHQAVLTATQTPSLRDSWDNLSKERDGWVSDTRDELRAALSKP
jgi:hypothetical protein